MDLSTSYLGIRLHNPFVAGASPLCDSLERARELVAAGCSMLTMRSLFEEQLDREALAHHAASAPHADSHGEASSYLPDVRGCVFGPEDYLEHLRALKATVDVPVVASLNGRSCGGWIDHARRIAEAGADALELNLYDVVTDPDRDASAIEQQMIDVVAAVTAAIGIPVAVKLSPFHTALPNLGRRLLQAGARGLVLFNRFFEPDLDTEALEVETHMMFSTSRELLLRLRWLAVLSGKLDGDLAVSGGVHTVRDAIKAVMCGAATVQVVAALLQGGPGQVRDLIEQLSGWLEQKGYDSLAQLRGSMDIAHAPDPSAYERSNYVHLLQTWRFA